VAFDIFNHIVQLVTQLGITIVAIAGVAMGRGKIWKRSAISWRQPRHPSRRTDRPDSPLLRIWASGTDYAFDAGDPNA